MFRNGKTANISKTTFGIPPLAAGASRRHDQAEGGLKFLNISLCSSAHVGHKP
jgi:hypothetical protein